MKKLSLLLLCLFIFSCSNDDNGSSDDVAVIPDDDNPIGGGDDDPMGGNDGILGFTPCEGGEAGDYPCNGYDLLGHLPLSVMNASAGNDIWGWTDTTTGKEYALMGLDNGTAFIDISDTENLIYLGKLPTATSPSGWRDIKVYLDHAYIGSEAANHGMQIFDLTKLRDVTNPPVTFSEDGRYTGIGNSHNIVINEDSGFVYPVGTARDDEFNGGVHFVNIQDPKNPVAAGGYGASGYTHDALVVTYNGPDTDYTGREILIGANESRVVVVDVTDKDNPSGITSFQYSNVNYTHQGWFTDDHRYYILGDETDEINVGFNSRTLIFDLEDLDNPVLHMTYTGPTAAIDHNGYVKGHTYYLANYTAGIRVLDISGIAGQSVVEEGFFDTFPANNTPAFSGVWSVYPYFDSEKIIISDINSGFFVIQKAN